MRKHIFTLILAIIVALGLIVSPFAIGSPSMAQESSDEEWVDLWFDREPVTTYDSSIVPGLADSEHPHVACIVHFDKTGNPVPGRWFVVTKDMEAVGHDLFKKYEIQGVKPGRTPGSRTGDKSVSESSATTRGTRTAHARQTMRCIADLPLTYQESWQTFTYDGTNVTNVSGQGGWYWAETHTGWQWLGGYWYDLGPTPPASYHQTYSYGDFWNDWFDQWWHRHEVWSVAYGSGAVAGSYSFSGSGPPGYDLVRQSWYD